MSSVRVDVLIDFFDASFYNAYPQCRITLLFRAAISIQCRFQFRIFIVLEVTPTTSHLSILSYYLQMRSEWTTSIELFVFYEKRLSFESFKSSQFQVNEPMPQIYFQKIMYSIFQFRSEAFQSILMTMDFFGIY